MIVRTFTSIEQVMDAYYKQLDYFVPLLHMFKMITLSTEITDGPMSGLRKAMQFDTCIKAGLTPKEGGSQVSEGAPPGWEAGVWLTLPTQ